jgi:hypothetical protein
MFIRNPLVIVLLVVVTLVLLRLYLERLRNSAPLKCPQCGEPLYRIQRIHWEYVLSFFLPIRPYLCENNECKWMGLRLKPLRRKH